MITTLPSTPAARSSPTTPKYDSSVRLATYIGYPIYVGRPMPAQTQEERKAETRTRLIAAAADLFARKGFHAVSAEAVADAADRTTGALYSHFGSKDGLLLALVEQWLDESAARILMGVEEATDLDGRLRA